MLDIKFIRENPELVAKAIKDKNEKADLNTLLNLDKRKRELQFEYDELRAYQNKVSQKIGELKRKQEDTKDIIAEMKDVAAKVKLLASKLSDVKDDLETELLTIPNLPHKEAPIGNSEDDNVLIREWGSKPEFGFKPRNHLEIAQKNNFLDFERAAKISGSGFAAYTGVGAKLERALINFMLDLHTKENNYKEISVPYIVSRDTMIGTGQLPKLENDMYNIEADDLFLIPTSEVSVTNFFADEIINYNSLPVKFVSYSPCFRREAGSHGKETKGLKRIHQFNKVELVRIVEPARSYQALEKMVTEAEMVLKTLGLHYRVLKLATGDMSFASSLTYDIEVWAPGAEEYLEVSSLSNFESFQARRSKMRYRDVDNNLEYPHTLNGSGLATPRLFIALLETYQQKDGEFKPPDILSPYL